MNFQSGGVDGTLHVGGIVGPSLLFPVTSVMDPPLRVVGVPIVDL